MSLKFVAVFHFQWNLFPLLNGTSFHNGFVSTLYCYVKSSFVVHFIFNLTTCELGIPRLRVSGSFDLQLSKDCRLIFFIYSVVESFPVDFFVIVMSTKSVWGFE